MGGHEHIWKQLIILNHAITNTSSLTHANKSGWTFYGQAPLKELFTQTCYRPNLETVGTTHMAGTKNKRISWQLTHSDLVRRLAERIRCDIHEASLTIETLTPCPKACWTPARESDVTYTRIPWQLTHSPLVRRLAAGLPPQTESQTWPHLPAGLPGSSPPPVRERRWHRSVGVERLKDYNAHL